MSTMLQRVLIGAAILVVAFLLVKSLNIGSPSDASRTATAPVEGTLPPGAFPTQLAGLGQFNVPTPDPSLPWKPVFEATGTDSQLTTPFTLSGGTVRVRYKVDTASSESITLLAVFVLAEGQPPDQAPGIP